jgi:hypothetical protein
MEAERDGTAVKMVKWNRRRRDGCRERERGE